MASLKSYIIKRALQIIPFVFFVIILNFFLIRAAPGDPLVYIIGSEGLTLATPEYIEGITHKLGLDRPLYEQLFRYLASLLSGDFGYSFRYFSPVLNLIMERITATLLLMLTAIGFSTALGILLGVTAARKRHSLTDYFTTVVSLVGYSLPTFWIAQMLVLVFAIHLRLFPSNGMVSVRVELVGVAHVLDVLWHLVLPSITLGGVYTALIARQTRTAMLEVLTQDFIIAAKAKGLDERTVIYKHALKNALLPVVTIVGMHFGQMFAGAILTETVFGWPGLGRLLYSSLVTRDYPLLMGMLIFVSLLVCIMNLVSDILYGVIDPRIRYR